MIKKSSNESKPYHSLSPTNKAENITPYINALNWALENRERIKNIAIAGPNGSGKSSFIQTFQKTNKNKKYHFLNISLATFKEEKVDEQTTTKNSNNDVLRLIELSILQQLIYHEKDNKIPDSKFTKIKNHKKVNLTVLTVGFILFFVAFASLLFPSFLSEILLLRFSYSIHKWIHYISLLITAIGFSIITYKSIRILNGFVIKKISIKDTTIEIDKTVSKSVLNNHIDEILYFFEVTQYNVVILEDIDRFEQTEVFTKLREINLLINNSKKIGKDVVFIYAIRDDMFQDYDRTKFFDFMIPIIPVINSSNSNDMLLKIIKDNNYEIQEDLLDNISLFIDDMRLLYNTMNEYHLYSKSLNKSLDQNKLLSMIVYKNIYPDDFTKLSDNKGVLYETISDKHRYIRTEIDKRDNQISRINEEIKILEAVKIRNIKELRIIYLANIVNKITTGAGLPFKAFWINNRQLDLDQASENENFEFFLKNSSLVFLYSGDNHYRQNFGYKFENIEKEINNDLTYKEREQLIRDLDNRKIALYKKKIEELEKTKNDIRKYKLRDLLSNEQIEIKSRNLKQNELINILLRNGYIDEDYIDYISIFYEGSLSKVDYQFLIIVKTQKKIDLDYKLDKIENLIRKIDVFEFDKEYILNYTLMEFLLSTNQQNEKREHLFSQLKNEADASLRFIDGFIDYTANLELFIKLLCAQWSNIWSFIENESNFSEEKKYKYFRLIIKHATIENINEIFTAFKSSISSKRSFLSIIDNATKLKEIIKVLNIKFADLDEASPKQLLDFVYDGNYYKINPKMLEIILKHKEAFNQKEFDTKNYSAIKLSRLQHLNEYVQNNINEYIESVYLKLETNFDEPQKYLSELLNNGELLIENKEKIITLTKTIIEDANGIEDLEVINVLLKELKILPTWENIILIYVKNENEFAEELVSYINSLNNAENLFRKKIDTETPDIETANMFIESLLLEETINNNSYSNILKSIPHDFPSLDFTKLSYQKVQLLVENSILSTNSANFEMIKNHFDGLHISLIEQCPTEFVENINSFELDNDDLLTLLKSLKISITLKENIINNYDLSTFSNEPLLLAQIGKLLLENKNFTLIEDITKLILTHSSLSDLDKIDLFIQKSDLFDMEDLDEIVSTLGEPFSKIAENGQRPLIDNNKVTKIFATILEEKGYISKIKFEQKGIRVITFMKKR
jgi:hypothetical protein